MSTEDLSSVSPQLQCTGCGAAIQGPALGEPPIRFCPYCGSEVVPSISSAPTPAVGTTPTETTASDPFDLGASWLTESRTAHTPPPRAKRRNSGNLHQAWRSFAAAVGVITEWLFDLVASPSVQTILLPGLGHFFGGEKAKGLILAFLYLGVFGLFVGTGTRFAEASLLSSIVAFMIIGVPIIYISLHDLEGIEERVRHAALAKSDGPPSLGSIAGRIVFAIIVWFLWFGYLNRDKNTDRPSPQGASVERSRQNRSSHSPQPKTNAAESSRALSPVVSQQDSDASLSTHLQLAALLAQDRHNSSAHLAEMWSITEQYELERIHADEVTFWAQARVESIRVLSESPGMDELIITYYTTTGKYTTYRHRKSFHARFRNIAGGWELTLCVSVLASEIDQYLSNRAAGEMIISRDRKWKNPSDLTAYYRDTR